MFGLFANDEQRQRLEEERRKREDEQKKRDLEAKMRKKEQRRKEKIEAKRQAEKKKMQQQVDEYLRHRELVMNAKRDDGAAPKLNRGYNTGSLSDMKFSNNSNNNSMCFNPYERAKEEAKNQSVGVQTNIVPKLNRNF